MRIKVIETVTEIEATAAEISASQILANAMNPYRAYEEEDEEEESDT